MLISNLARRQIEVFAKGNIHLSPDAYASMEKFIEEFGKEPTSQCLTVHARQAKIVLQKLKTRNIRVQNNVKTVAIPTSRLKSVNTKQTSAEILKKYMDKHKAKKLKLNTRINYQISQSHNELKKQIKLLTPIIKKQAQKQVENINKLGKEASEVGKVVGKEIGEVGKVVTTEVSNIVRRYGVAIAALWGICGAGNSGNVGVKSSYTDIMKNKIEYHLKQAEQKQKEQVKTKVLTANNFSPNSLAEKPKETKKYTIADLKYKSYKFSREDIQALQVSEQGAELAEHAKKVVRGMNYAGYCYRGVKRMFNRANLGEMHGGSAYMAKKYLDNNTNFVRINCNIEDLKYLPQGSVVVFDKGKSRKHGHIGVLGEDKNGKIVDMSSKIYNVRSTLGGYSDFAVYIHADTPLPQRVINNINQISVLNNESKILETETPITQTNDYFAMALINQYKGIHG